MVNRTKKRWQIIGISVFALFIISWLELFLQRKHHLIGGGINRAFLFLLMNIHIVAIVILLYIIIRQSIKLFVELHRKNPGSNFKKNLLFAFTIFSVIPSFLVFFIAGKLITSGIDNWFTARIETGLKNSLLLHREETKNIRSDLKNNFDILYKKLENTNQLDNTKIEKIIRSNANLNKYEIYIWSSVNGQEFIGSLNQEINIWRKFRQHNDRSMLNLKIRFFELVPKTLFDFYGSLYCIKKLNQHYVVVVYRYPKEIRYPLIKIQDSIADYQQLKSMHNPIYWNYFLTFILVTLLIIFLSIWCAFYLAKGISKPIQELLNATEKIQYGDWNFQISYNPASDLSNLAIGFNKMTKAVQQAHTQLEQQNKEMLMILENLKEAFFYVNKYGRILNYNSASKELVQKYLNLTRFKNKKIIFFGPDVTKKFFELVRKLNASGKKQLTQEINFTFRSDQRTLMVQLRYINTPFTKPNLQKTENGLLILIEDLTDIVKMNQAKTWQQAAKQMAHEIKNPLTPIQLATQRLQRKFRKNFTNDAVFTDCTNTILNHVKIIKDLVTNFAEFAKLPANNIENLDLNKIIKEVSCLYEISYPEINFHHDLQEFLPLIKIDKKKIKRAIINLIDNSIRALTQNKQNKEKKIRIKTSFKSGLNQIELLISDNGPGIPSSVKNRLFMPHVSTEKKNTGLGLAIVHEIITQAGGSIRLLPTEQGATFQILFK